jgi:hypothetical protein
MLDKTIQVLYKYIFNFNCSSFQSARIPFKSAQKHRGPNGHGRGVNQQENQQNIRGNPQNYNGII